MRKTFAKYWLGSLAALFVAISVGIYLDGLIELFQVSIGAGFTFLGFTAFILLTFASLFWMVE